MTDRRITNSSIALSRTEIARLVNQYIGVSSGYLGDFTYPTHAAFYPEYCDLDINPDEYEGTTRERFITILSSRAPRDQAAIVRGVINRFPVGAGPATRTAEVRNEFLQIIQRLESGTPVPSEVPSISSDVVLRAIADADLLLASSGATSGVDRIPMRNRASMAHPNYQLLGHEEALLVINVGRTLISYLDSKLSQGAT